MEKTLNTNGYENHSILLGQIIKKAHVCGSPRRQSVEKFFCSHFDFVLVKLQQESLDSLNPSLARR
jgi:hypothetical protein